MEDQLQNQPINQATPSAQHHHLPVLIVVLVILLMGVAGWWYLKGQKSTTSSTTDTSSTAVPEVNTANDLSSAGSFLSDSQIDEQLDTTDIDEVLSN